MKMFNELKARKEELGYTCSEISKLSGVPLGTVQKVFSGETARPRKETLSRILKALGISEGQGNSYVKGNPYSKGIPCSEKTPYLTGFQNSSMVCEPPFTYGTSALSEDGTFRGKHQGEFTVEDYLALPDDERYELIDGVLYAMASPTSNHQEIAGYLYYQLMSCVEQHDVPCRPYIAPLDVQLDKDNRTILQPDVILNCDPEKNIGPRLFGAPDFVAEVLSPSSSNRDLIIKLNKYFHAGVREYWILDPKKRTVTVYIFGKETEPVVYTFEDDIPVGISNGLCTISMKGILRWLI